ncbi:MAG: iron-containing alcohol dehydrogenase [Clostridia bacterium]|nr:iron-containing alcohol dehydrogenase [Clostridia bacterium]
MKQFSNFNFLMQTEIVFGKDAELQTADLIKKYGGSRVLIVMDGGGFIKKSGLFDRVAKNLTDNGLQYFELEGVQPNPRLSLVLKGLELVKQENIDFLLAIGGGSTIDTSKAIGLAMANDGDFWDFFTGKRVPVSIAPIGAISTIAATGSETSGSAVIMDDIKDHTKRGNMFNHIRTRFAVMNPELTYTVPAYQTGAGSTDILAHAFDSYFTYMDSYLGDKFSEAAMCTAVKYGPIALKDPTNYEARAELMLASSFSHNDTCRIGRARIPYSGGGHNLERHLSAKFDSAHGAGLAVMMPALLAYNIEHDETTIAKTAQFAVRVFDVEPDPANPKEVAREGIKRFRAWLQELGMPATLHELAKREVTDADIEELVSMVQLQPNGDMAAFGHNNKEDIKRIFESVR